MTAAEEKLVDLMQALEDSVNEAKGSRDRKLQADRMEANGGVDEYAELVCPLPVIRLTTDENDHDLTVLDPCGEHLFVEHTETRYLLAGGECDAAGPEWKISCIGGHTLVMPDYQGGEPCHELSLNVVLHLVQEALEAIGTVAQDGDMAFKPLAGTEGD